MAGKSTATASNEVVPYRGLRQWLERVDQMGELLRVNGAHWDAEMGAITYMLTESAERARGRRL